MSDEISVSNGAPEAAGQESLQPLNGELAAIQQAIAPQRTSATSESSSAAERGSQISGDGLSSYWHAFRRRWFVATSLGILCGGVAAVAVWFNATTNYTATALIRVSAGEQHVVFKIDDERSTFDIYKATQAQLLVSDFVLNAALRKIGNLESIKREEDPLRWLARTLQVDPGNAEILRVSLTTTDGKEAAAIVQAVVDSYMVEAVDGEKKNRRKHLAELEKISGDKAQEERTMWTKLSKITDQVGSGNAGALSIKEEAALRQFWESRTEVVRLKSELRQAQAALEAKLAASKAAPAKSKASLDVDAAVEADPAYGRLVTGPGGR